MHRRSAARCCSLIAALLAFWPRRRRAGFRIAALVALVDALRRPGRRARPRAPSSCAARCSPSSSSASCGSSGCGRPSSAPPGRSRPAPRSLALAARAGARRRPRRGSTTRRARSTPPARARPSSPGTTTTAPLDWPRDGREVLRVAGQRALLEGGQPRRLRRRSAGSRPAAVRPAAPPRSDHAERQRPTACRRWSHRHPRQRPRPALGDLPHRRRADGVTMPRRRDRSRSAPGVWTAGRTLRRGDAYRATVYVPQPSRARARGAPAPTTARDADRRTRLRRDRPPHGTAALRSLRPRFGVRSTRVARSRPRRRPAATPTAPALEPRGCARIYALSQRLLRRRARRPYAYVQAVQRYLADGFTYTETPPPQRPQPLDGFLFDAQPGYCQQFSGAMALLLRMGGVPARVATGFAPGLLRPRRQASTSCATSTRTPGSRPGSPASAGSSSTRRPPPRRRAPRR